MLCCRGSTSAVVVEEKKVSAAPPAPKKEAPAAAPAAPEEKEVKPSPMIFALMRNGHEVIRGAQKDLKETVEQHGDVALAQQQWADLLTWTRLHMEMEEGQGDVCGFFKLLDDKCEGVATQEHLSDQHTELHHAEVALTEALDSRDLEAIKKAFAAFEEANLNHLKKEEDVMMPKVSQLAQAGHPMKKYMQQDILAVVSNSPADMEFFIKFANRTLEKHHEGLPRVRVFDHALWAVATPEQWTQWDAWIKESLSEQGYKELHQIID